MFQITVGTGTQDIITVQEKLKEQETMANTSSKKLSDVGVRINALDRKITEVEQKRGGGNQISPGRTHI